MQLVLDDRSGGGSGAGQRRAAVRLARAVEAVLVVAVDPAEEARPTCPVQGSAANLSTVAIRKQGSRR